jgi:hypothetical protein
MKFSLKAVAVAVMLAIPTVSHAQFDTDVQLQMKGFRFPTTGTNYPNGGKAGGFAADFTIDFPKQPSSFTDYLIWCIDPDRTVSPEGGPYTFWAFTAQDFAANTNYGGKNGHNLSVADMQGIVGTAFDLEKNWWSYSDEQRADRQGSIWALFRGETPVANTVTMGNLEGWYVLFNDQNQTFITRVPEPANFGLIIAGFAGLGLLMVIRRRTA